MKPIEETTEIEEISEADFEKLVKKWNARLIALTEKQIQRAGVPIHTYVKEAIGYAQHARELYDPPKKGQPPRPHLGLVKFRLPREVIEEIDELAHMLSYAEALALLGKTTPSEAAKKLARAVEVLDSIESCVEFLLDDDVHEPADDELASLKEQEAELGDSLSVRAQVLLAYVLLARPLEERLKEDKTFDPNWLSEGEQLAHFLRHYKPLTPAEKGKNLQLRDQIQTLLIQQIQKLRKAANHVFRKHPDLCRLFRSTYERRRRAKSRALQKMKEIKPPVNPTDPPAPVTPS